MSHPDLIKNFSPDDWDLNRLMDYIGDTLGRIAATGVAMELNTSGVNKTVPEMNPGIEILAEMQRRGIPVVIGSDAHTPERIADGFKIALDTLTDVGYTRVSIFLDRRRKDLPIEEVRRSLISTPDGGHR